MNYLFLIIVLAVVLAVIAIAMFTNFNLDNEHYDRLKWVVIRWSYFVVFVGLIAKTFNIPHGVETVTIVAGLGAMLAGLLGVSTNEYNKEMESIDEDDFYEEFYDDIDEEAENAKEESGDIDG